MTPVPPLPRDLKWRALRDDPLTVVQYKQDDQEHPERTFRVMDVLDDLSNIKKGQKLYLRKSNDGSYRVVPEDNDLKRKLRIHCLSCGVEEPSIRTVQVLHKVLSAFSAPLPYLDSRAERDRLASQVTKTKVQLALRGVERLLETYEQVKDDKGSWSCCLAWLDYVPSDSDWLDPMSYKSFKKAIAKIIPVNHLIASLKIMEDNLRPPNILSRGVRRVKKSALSRATDKVAKRVKGAAHFLNKRRKEAVATVKGLW